MSHDPNQPPPYGPPPGYGYPPPGPGGPPPGWGPPPPPPGGPPWPPPPGGPPWPPPPPYAPVPGAPYGPGPGQAGYGPAGYGTGHDGPPPPARLGLAGILLAIGNLLFGLCCGCGDLFNLQVGVALGTPEGKAEINKALEDQRKLQRQNQTPDTQEVFDQVMDDFQSAVNRVDASSAGRLAAISGLTGLARLLLLLSGALLFARVRISRLFGVLGAIGSGVGSVLVGQQMVRMLPDGTSSEVVSWIWGSTIANAAWPAIALLILLSSAQIKAFLERR